MDKSDWLRERTKGIGGSDAGVVLGLSPWKSRLELWNEKVNGITIERDTPDLYWGLKLEPLIVEEYTKKTKRSVSVHKQQLVSPKYPFMIANIDGIVIDYLSKGIGVLEIKTKNAYAKWEEDIPNYYYARIQHYLSVTGLSWASFVVLNLG